MNIVKQGNALIKKYSIILQTLFSKYGNNTKTSQNTNKRITYCVCLILNPDSSFATGNPRHYVHW